MVSPHEGGDSRTGKPAGCGMKADRRNEMKFTFVGSCGGPTPSSEPRMQKKVPETMGSEEQGVELDPQLHVIVPSTL